MNWSRMKQVQQVDEELSKIWPWNQRMAKNLSKKQVRKEHEPSNLIT